MPNTTASLKHALDWPELWPSLRNGLWVVALFLVGVVVARQHADRIQGLLADHTALGVAAFLATSAVAVLMPLLTNLPLVPLAVLAWGPWWTAALLLTGWTIGAVLAFALGRHARAATLRYFPSVQRHADVDRLIHPQHRLLSLVLLRMTFPVDVLSYSLGLFSRSTTAAENLFSTTLGAAPFALLFALLPTLPATSQLSVFVTTVLAFALYALWVWRGPRRIQ